MSVKIPILSNLSNFNPKIWGLKIGRKCKKKFAAGGAKFGGAYFLNKKWPEAKTLQIFIIHQKTHFDEVLAKSERVKWEFFWKFAVLTWNDPNAIQRHNKESMGPETNLIC